MVAKNGKGKWRYLMFQLMFSLEGRAMRAWDARDDAPLALPANDREALLVADYVLREFFAPWCPQPEEGGSRSGTGQNFSKRRRRVDSGTENDGR